MYSICKLIKRGRGKVSRDLEPSTCEICNNLWWKIPLQQKKHTLSFSLKTTSSTTILETALLLGERAPSSSLIMVYLLNNTSLALLPEETQVFLNLWWKNSCALRRLFVILSVFPQCVKARFHSKDIFPDECCLQMSTGKETAFFNDCRPLRIRRHISEKRKAKHTPEVMTRKS